MLEASEDYTHAPIDAAALNMYERRRQITFPEPLRSVLLKVNGGELEWNVFKRGSDIFLIHSFFGILLKGQAAHSLRAVSEHSPGLFDTKNAGDPAKIFLFSQEWPNDWHWALNFSTSPKDPSIWIIEPSGSHARSWQVFRNWGELESSRYYGEEAPGVDFESWPDGKLLIDDHNTEPMLRQRMVLQNGIICLQHEYVWRDEPERREFCFELASVARQSLRMEHGREERPAIKISFAAPAVSTNQSKLLGGNWMNGKRHLNSRESQESGALTLYSLDKAVMVFRLLADGRLEI